MRHNFKLLQESNREMQKKIELLELERQINDTMRQSMAKIAVCQNMGDNDAGGSSTMVYFKFISISFTPPSFDHNIG